MRRIAGLAFVAGALLLAGPLASRAAAAGVPEEAARLFAVANDHYASGEYEKAIADYRQLLAQGVDSEAVHYNLGNALYKQNQLGSAILELEKASAQAPDDPDIRANLEFLGSLTVDRTTALGAQTTTFFLERLLQLTSIDQDAVMVGVLWVVIAFGFSLWIMASTIRTRRIAVWFITIVAFPLALVGGGLTLKLYRAATLTEAVILEERVDVLSGPGGDNTSLFTVHEGLKVRVRSMRGSWCEVSLESGLSGWVPSSAMGTI